MTTTTTLYARLPELAPRGAGETAEQYGLRALLFITAERLTVTVDDEGLKLAAHCFRLAVGNPELSTVAAERLADVGRSISSDLARRDAATMPAIAPAEPVATQTPAAPVSGGQPVPRPVQPVRPTPPAGAVVPQVSPASPAAPRQVFIAPRPVARPTAPAPVPVADWGF